MAMLPPVATLPPESTAPPCAVVPPVGDPPVALEEHPKDRAAPAKAMASADNRIVAVLELRLHCRFVMRSSCILALLDLGVASACPIHRNSDGPATRGREGPNLARERDVPPGQPNGSK